MAGAAADGSLVRPPPDQHVPTGDLYSVMAGEVSMGFKDGVDAWFVTAQGDVVFLGKAERTENGRRARGDPGRQESAADASPPAAGRRMSSSGSTITLPPHFLTTASYWNERKNPYRVRVETGCT